MFFALREKTVEGEGVFADVGVDEQGDFGVKFAQRGEGGKRDGDKIADAANIKNDSDWDVFRGGGRGGVRSSKESIAAFCSPVNAWKRDNQRVRNKFGEVRRAIYANAK